MMNFILDLEKIIIQYSQNSKEALNKEYTSLFSSFNQTKYPSWVQVDCLYYRDLYQINGRILNIDRVHLYRYIYNFLNGHRVCILNKNHIFCQSHIAIDI